MLLGQLLLAAWQSQWGGLWKRPAHTSQQRMHTSRISRDFTMLHCQLPQVHASVRLTLVGPMAIPNSSSSSSSTSPAAAAPAGSPDPLELAAAPLSAEGATPMGGRYMGSGAGLTPGVRTWGGVEPGTLAAIAGVAEVVALCAAEPAGAVAAAAGAAAAELPCNRLSSSLSKASAEVPLAAAAGVRVEAACAGPATGCCWAASAGVEATDGCGRLTETGLGTMGGGATGRGTAWGMAWTGRSDG